jgi:hypothetical protein
MVQALGAGRRERPRPARLAAATEAVREGEYNLGAGSAGAAAMAAMLSALDDAPGFAGLRKQVCIRPYV